MTWRRNVLDARIRDRVRLNKWQALVALLLLCVCPGAYAKCPVASVAVKGHILPGATENRVIKVELLTPKGNFAEQADVAESAFSVIVKFPTASSYSPVLGHRCNNLPEKVIVIAKTGDKVLVRKELSFKNDFESAGLNEYRLRKELVLGIGTQIAPGHGGH